MAAVRASSASYGGGNGGGLLRLTAGTLQVDGSINADGNGGYYGGGSGGGIRLDVGTLSGNGWITARGGASSKTSQSGGAGGGGRMAIYYDSLSLTEDHLLARGPERQREPVGPQRRRRDDLPEVTCCDHGRCDSRQPRDRDQPNDDDPGWRVCQCHGPGECPVYGSVGPEDGSAFDPDGRDSDRFGRFDDTWRPEPDAQHLWSSKVLCRCRGL